jgi:uncharacterized protein (DUF2236 family)
VVFDRPFTRLRHTFIWVLLVVYGTRREAQEACARINAIHEGVVGTVPPESATANVPAGTPYRANDPLLQLGLYLALVVALVDTHERFVGPISAERKDRIVQEWGAVLPLTGVPTEHWPRTYAGVLAWLARERDEAAGGQIVPGPGSRVVMGGIRRPPGTPLWARVPWRVWMFLTAGLMDPGLRERYGLPWSPAHAAVFRAMGWLGRHGGSRAARVLVPVPAYEWARYRSSSGRSSTVSCSWGSVRAR